MDDGTEEAAGCKWHKSSYRSWTQREVYAAPDSWRDMNQQDKL